MIEIADKWIRQPPQALGINRDSPLTAGLTRLTMPGVDFGRTRSGIFVPASLGAMPTAIGVAGNFNGSASLDVGPMDSGALTVMVGAIADSGSLKYLFGLEYNGAAEPLTLRINSGSLEFSVYEGGVVNDEGGVVNDLVSVSAPSAGTYNTYYGIAPPDGTTGTHEVGFFSQQGAKTSATKSIQVSARNGVEAFVGAGKGLGSPWRHYAKPIVWAATWKRQLTSAELAEVARNPWQLFAKRPKRVFLPGSGGAYSLVCAAGSYALTGQPVALSASRSMAAAQGSYTITGQDVALLRLFTLAAAQGAYSLSGQAVALAVSRLLAAGQGSYAITGRAVGLLASRVLAAGQGSYAFTGQAVGLVYTPLGSYSLISDAGSYSLTGQAVGLLASRVLAAEAGSYGLSGQDVGLVYTPAGASYTLTAEAGSYAITGQDISFARTYVLAASAGSYTLTGRDVTLSYSGAPPVSVPDMVRTARGVARLAIHGTTRNVIRGYRP